MSGFSRITIADVARQAGVSISTVDRVLNARAPVRSDTALRIRAAADALGFHAAGVLGERVQGVRPRATLAFVLQEPRSSFYRAVARALEEAVEAEPLVRGHAVIHFMKDISPEAVADQMARMGTEVSALALHAADHPLVSARIDELADRDVPVFSLISDLSASRRAGYVGLDNRRKGRVAAWFLTQLAHQPGPVAIFVGSHRFQCQELCEMSFRSYMREHAPHFELLEPVVTMEDDKVALEGMRNILRRHDDLVGFYVVGSGVDGVLKAMDAEGIRADGPPLIGVGHELTPATRAGLTQGRLHAVFGHPVDEMARQLVRAMALSLTRSSNHFQQIILPLRTETRESV